MSRRLTRALVVVAAASVVLGGCAPRQQNNSSDAAAGGGNQQAPAAPANAADPAGDGNATCSDITIAYAGTINGDNAALGQNILEGVRLAVNRHNDANKDCQVTLREVDTEGTPDKAPGVVTQLANDPKVLGVVGLPFSGESKAAGNIFDQKGLVAVTPAATNPQLTDNGWKTFFRALGNDAVQGPAAAKFMTENLKAQKICVVQDDSEYGIGLANQVKQALGDKASCENSVKSKQTDFAAVVDEIAAQSPDAVFYSGYYREGAPFAQQLADKGVEAKFVGPDGLKDDEFVKGAGDAAANAYFTCPCVPADQFTEFSTAYKASAKRDPGTYSAEGYDAATILLTGIDSGITTRKELLNYVQDYQGQGLTKKFDWDSKGELKQTPVWSYRVENGKIVKNSQIS